MIQSVRHRGLKRLWERNDESRLPAVQVRKIRRILNLLDEAEPLEEVNLPGYRLHELKGNLQGHYAVRVTGNYRITFRLEDGNTFDVDYTDYH